MCPFCKGEYKNLSVHLRFCKAKKEIEASKIEETIPEEVISKEVVPEIKIETTTKDIDNLEGILNDAIKDSEILKKVPSQKSKKAEVEQTIPTEEQFDLVNRVLEKNKEQAAKEAKEILEKDLVIVFNEPKDLWEETLIELLKEVEQEEVIHIKLMNSLAHEFVEILGICRYPSDRFMNVIRNYCSDWKSEMNDIGGQTFICTRK